MGVDPAVLRGVSDRVVDLPGTYLGLATLNEVLIDADAADHGWFVDQTPGEYSEFTRPGDQPEQGRIDLLTTVTHEFGHILGLDDLDPLGHDHGLMAAALPTGVRRLPAADVPLPGSPEVGSALPTPLIDWQPQAVIEIGSTPAGRMTADGRPGAQGGELRTEDRGQKAAGALFRARKDTLR